MQITRLKISNFRGISETELLLPTHGVLVGDNNTGKTTVFEAIDLVLGPDRLNRRIPIDEHDFYGGKYLTAPTETNVPQNADVVEENTASNPEIIIEIVVTNLSAEQNRHFNDNLEFWDSQNNKLYDEPNPEGVDAEHISAALRIKFIGCYIEDEDDFEGKTYFSSTYVDETSPQFTRKDKQRCAFLYLRSVRTGSRALSLERGSLLDIILRIKEVRPQMWEGTISQLANQKIATDEALGVTHQRLMDRFV